MGKFNTHGGYFAPEGYFRINEGGSHEENPNGGVQVGVDQEGTPNMLEEGEPVYNDYVYSDNIYADGGILEKYNIPAKYAGKLYSKIADAFVDEAEDRPNDPISNNGLNAMLVRLADAQEEQKAIAQQKELEEQLANMTPEELDALEAMLAEQEAAEQQAAQEQVMREQAMAEQQATPEEQAMAAQQMQAPVQEVPQQPMMACGGKMRKYAPGGLLIDPPVISPYNVGTQGMARDATMIAGNPTFVQMPEVRAFTPEEIERAKEQQRFENDVMSFVPVLGIPNALMNASDETNAGNYGSASLEAAAALPLVGGLLKGLKAGRKTVKAARAFTKASNALAEAERAENKVVKLSKAGKDITAAKKTADALADKAIDLMVESENARRVASGVVDAVEKTAKAGKKLKWGTWQKVGNFVEKPGFVGGLGAVSGGGYGWWNMREDRKAATDNPSNTVGVTVIDDSDLFNFANGGPMNKFDKGSKLYPSNPRYGYMASTSMQPMYWTLEPTRRRQRTPYIGSPALTVSDPVNVNWNINPSGRKLNNSKSNTVTARNRLAPISGYENNQYMSLIHNYTRDIMNANDLQNIDDLNATQNEYKQNILAQKSALPNPTVFSFGSDADNGKNNSVDNGKKNGDALPTWMRYAGLANALGDMAWNLAQRPDRYHINPYRPVLPEGRMDLIDPIFNPLDENMAVNDLLASNAGTVYGLRNSGVGPSLGANLLAADYNAGRNMGAARTQIWDANNQRRNQVIAQRNQNGQILGNFNYGINRERAQILNDAKVRNMHNSLMEQRLNNAAVQEKWNAFNTSKDALISGLSNIGLENMRLNNANDLYDYVRLPNGRMAYVPKMNTAKCGGKMSKKTKK